VFWMVKVQAEHWEMLELQARQLLPHTQSFPDSS
jgi:hypothetical protein